MFFFSSKLCSYNSCSVLRKIAFSGCDHVLPLSAVSKEEALLFRFKTHKKRVTASVSDYQVTADVRTAGLQGTLVTVNHLFFFFLFLVFVPSLDFASHRESRRTESEPRAPPGPLSRSFCQSQFTSVSLAAVGRLCGVLHSQMRFLGGLSLAWNNPPPTPNPPIPHLSRHGGVFIMRS